MTRIEVVTDRMHGIDIPDPYRWLEDQQSPETRAWIAEQNAYTRAILDAIPGRNRLRAQLEKLFRVDFQSAPKVRNGRYFFRRQSAKQDQGVIVVREGVDGPERVLVDPMTLSPDGSVSARIMNVTPDGRILAWAKRKGGEDEAEVFFLDVKTGQPLADRLPRGVYYSVFVLPDKSGFLYSRRRAEGMRVLEHRFGAPTEEDRELFGAGIPDDKIIWIQFSEDGRFVAAFVVDGLRSHVYVLDRSASSEFQPLITDIAARFVGRFGGHTLFLKTTWNAPNGRVLAIDLENPSRENWREVIPSSKDSVIMGMRPAGHKLLVSFLHNVSTRLAIFEPDGKLVRDISLPTLGSGYFVASTGLTSTLGPTWDSDEIFYGFSSFAQPVTVYRYDLATAKQSVWYKRNLPVDSDAIETTQVWYTSKDGTRVPMFVVSKKGAKRDGNRSVLLTGYGGYGAINSPFFSPVAAMWVDRGGIYAVANIRGGGEFGEKWHRDGMLENKQNSFDDFIAAAEWLIENKYTHAAKLAIRGSSNGGMLVAAAATQRPDLFRAVVCAVPHLDMLRYHKFLKAAPWVKEYGNPDVAEEFEYLIKYSPYHQVRNGERYPAMLLITGDRDTRVAPLHARKMAARMQAASRSGLPVLLRYDLIAGHVGSGALSHRLDQRVDEMAFLYAQLGLTP
ncbi:prolyl oligopeptidase family serine peptidase [Acidobacteria bacterium AH-259-L09]|nr:prolyl oligopeptidase family serine peptidase [Acidobacteria bacterium AH-259-L09]